MARKARLSREPFGLAVERLMAESNATYRGLGSKTGVSGGYLNHLVHGNRPVPDDDVIERIAHALDIEPEYFRKYRLRLLVERLETMPEAVDRLYKRLVAR
jgi:transcriptional regulator with XRE-family HTH domain